MPEALKDLVERAFEAAHAAGKADWNRMTIAVLKNRLLQLTNRTFNEAVYGGGRLLDLLAHDLNELVEIDRTTKPPIIEWKNASQKTVPESALSLGRIRADLWRAILDYSSHAQYEWDVAHGQARPVELAAADRRLPTIDEATLFIWRKSFAEEHEPSLSSDEEKEQLRTWVDQGLRTQLLPRRLRAAWNTRLKRNVVERLEQWFKTTGFSMPRILQEAPPTSMEGATASELRRFIHRCVDQMSEEDLKALPLPALAAFHAKG